MPPSRRAVHAASGKRLGDANPRQEGPADLRLVPPALAAWATAALVLDAAVQWVTGVAVVCLVAAGVLLLTRRSAGPRVSVAAVLLCVAAAAVSAGLHGADLRRGPVPGLAREYATVTAEIEVTSDPRLTRPRVEGDRPAPTSVLIKGEVRRVEKAGGEAVDTRAPVLVMVDAAGFGRSAGEGSAAPTAGSG
ncbi:MBL fold metallo-hydrolase, partial [Streptomyces sp. S3(2020)]|nr:MBL fold metallo-hydrolase [Streptomyces sp. S3(2020)]